MFIIQRFWANCTIFNTKLTLSEACQLLSMQIQLATFYRFAIFQEEVDEDLQKVKYKDKDTQTKTSTKCLQDPMYAIFSQTEDSRI